MNKDDKYLTMSRCSILAPASTRHDTTSTDPDLAAFSSAVQLSFVYKI